MRPRHEKPEQYDRGEDRVVHEASGFPEKGGVAEVEFRWGIRHLMFARNVLSSIKLVNKKIKFYRCAASWNCSLRDPNNRSPAPKIDIGTEMMRLKAT